MTKKYICKLCNKPCILEVEEDAEEPYVCPYNETEYSEWELMKEDDNND